MLVTTGNGPGPRPPLWPGLRTGPPGLTGGLRASGRPAVRPGGGVRTPRHNESPRAAAPDPGQRPGLRLLTPRAIMGRAPRQLDAHDRRPAAHAGPALSTVDRVLVLKLALQARAADVIADAGAALVDGPRQHRHHGLPQPL